MRVLRVLVVTIVATLLLAPGLAAGETLTASGTITVQATVLPALTILVDNADRIVRIYSNTTAPTDNILVFRNTIDAQNAVPVSGAILAQYHAVVPAEIKAGILYDRSSIAQLFLLKASVWQ